MFGPVRRIIGYQSPTPRPRRGSSKRVNRGLRCRAKCGGGLVLPPGRYGSHEGLLRNQKTPGQRSSDEARGTNHPPSGYKETAETIGSTHRDTSVLGGKAVSSGTRMTRRCEGQKEAAMSTPLLTPKATTLLGTWNVRTMYEAGNSAQIAAEMTA